MRVRGALARVLAIGLVLGWSAVARAAVTIDCDFPGGNVIVEKIEGDVVRVRPDLRDTAGGWFYWCFRVRGAEGRTVKFVFTKETPVGVRGPAVSGDEGMTWRWAGWKESKATTSSFEHTFGPEDKSVRLSFGMTYTQAHLDAFLKQYGGNPALRREVLCESKKGRKVERLRLGKVEGGPKFRVLVTARHHACEMMADYAAEGIVAAVLADDEAGKWLRANVEVAVIPFVDKDGVEDGDQGKNRKPRDHNRDYSGESVHPETAAIRKWAPEWGAGKLAVMIDLHCPHIRGGTNEHIYQVGRAKPEQAAAQRAFGEILEKAQTGPLVYRVKGDVAYGSAWNTAGNTTQGQTSSGWAADLPGVKLGTTFELPYANASGKEVNAATARAFGRDVGVALRTYLGQQ